jgi:hypothetical protein
MEGGGLEDVPASSGGARDTRLARGTFFSESDGYNDQYPFIRLRNLFSKTIQVRHIHKSTGRKDCAGHKARPLSPANSCYLQEAGEVSPLRSRLDAPIQ